MSANNMIGLNGIRQFLESLFEGDVHAMRVLSLSNATLGVLSSASLAVHARGESRTAAQWLGKGGRAKLLRQVLIMRDGYEVATVVCVHAKGMKAPWCLVSSDAELKARAVIDGYAKRWRIEPGFRDYKDARFGTGMSQTRIGSTQRRDRLFLISAFATALLTLLGAAGESLDYDRLLKSNTVKKRVHSLFRQGCMLYELIPNMPAERLNSLMERFSEMLNEQGVFKKVFGVLFPRQAYHHHRDWLRKTA